MFLRHPAIQITLEQNSGSCVSGKHTLKSLLSNGWMLIYTDAVHLFHSYDAFLGVFLSEDVKHVSPIAINNSVLDFGIFSSVGICGFHTSNGCANWGGFKYSKMDGVCKV